jgi:hypothetical protein
MAKGTKKISRALDLHEESPLQMFSAPRVPGNLDKTRTFPNHKSIRFHIAFAITLQFSGSAVSWRKPF